MNQNRENNSDCTEKILEKIGVIFPLSIAVFGEMDSIETLTHAKVQRQENHDIFQDLDCQIGFTGQIIGISIFNQQNTVTGSVEEISQRHGKG